MRAATGTKRSLSPSRSFCLRRRKGVKNGRARERREERNRLKRGAALNGHKESKTEREEEEEEELNGHRKDPPSDQNKIHQHLTCKRAKWINSMKNYTH